MVELITESSETEFQQVPDDWEWKLIGHLMSLQNGVNADGEAYGSGIPFINVLEVITNSHLQITEIPGKVELPDALLNNYLVRKGDILFNRTSETQEEVGLASVYLEDDPVVFGGFVIRGQLQGDQLDTEYAGYALRASTVRSQIISRAQGAVRANIGQQELAKVSVPLPPRPEQRAIAEALSDVDALIERLDALIAKKRAIKTATMQRLLTGQQRLPGFDGAWETRRLGEIVEVGPDALSGSTDPQYEFKYISLEDVEKGRLMDHTTLTFESAPSRARLKVQDGDVLISTVRPNLRAHLLFDRPEPDWICSTGFSVLRPIEGRAVSEFVFNHFMEGTVPSQIESLLTGSNYPAINTRDLKALQIPVPPSVREQRAIATILSDMDAEIEALEARRDKTQNIKQGMMQELLMGRTRLV